MRLSRPSLVLSLEASTVDVAASGHRLVVDRTGCLVLPQRTLVTFRSKTPSNRVVVLGFGEVLIGAMTRRYSKLGVDRARLERWLRRVELLARTVWVHEIVHRYVFEREALGEHDNLATKFLEVEILKELYFLLRDRDDGAERGSAGQKYSAPVERAVAWIEAHLFEPCGLAPLGRERERCCAVSAGT